MADLPDLDLSTLQQPTGTTPVQAQPVREVIAPLRSFQAEPVPPPPQATTLTARPLPATDENTIQIAPHPTTNRYPWAPVSNPQLPPLPVVQLPPPVARELPLPAAQEQAVVPPPVDPVQPVLEPEPEPAPAAPPEPIHLPPPPVPEPVAAPPPPPLQPILPVQPIGHFELQPALQPLPAPEPQPHPKAGPGHHPVHIYSDYTREVWHVFRPNKAVRVMVLGFMLLVIVGAVGFWVLSGAPTDINNLPFLQPLLHAE